VVTNLLLAFATRVWERQTTKREEVEVDFRYTLQLPGGDVKFNVDSLDEDEVLYARRVLDGRISLDLWDDALRRFGELAREHGFTPVVSYTPSAHTAYGERVRFSDPELRPLLAEFSHRQREFLAERASAMGYLFRDLTPDLQQAAARSDASSLLYDPHSIHLTPAGHEAIADSLAHFLAERGLAAEP
jgi:hypothetical protein